MLIPIFETGDNIPSYPLSATLEAQSTLDLQNSATLDLNLPYGNQATGFAAGMIAQLLAEGGNTVLELSDGTCPLGIFADSFVDTLKSGMASFYLLCQNLIAKCKQNYDISQLFPVNQLCATVPSGTNQGKLTPSTNYAAQPTVAIVMETPASAANDDYMVIMTDLNY